MHAPGRKLSNAYEPEPFVPASPYIASPPQQHQQHRQHSRIPSVSRGTPTATTTPPASSFPHPQSEPRLRPSASRPNNTVPIPIPSSQSNSNRFHPPHPPQQQHQLHHLQQSISPSAHPSRENSVARVPVRPSNHGVTNPHFHNDRPDRPQPTPPVPEQLNHRHPLLSPSRQKPDTRQHALNLDKPGNETDQPNSVPRAPATTWQIQLPLPSPEEPESVKVSSEDEPDSPNNNGSIKRNPSRDSIEREQKEQLEMADRLWMEEQAAFQREIEEQRRLYNASQKQDRPATAAPSETSPVIPVAPPVSLVPISPALPYRSGSLPKSLSAGVARSRSGSLTHLINPHNGVVTPPHSFASVYGGSTKEERQKWRRDIRKVMEEQLRLQTNGHAEPADHHTTSSPAEDHSPRGRDALSHSDESRHPLRSRQDSKSHSFERSPSRDDDEEERRQEAERNRATAVSRQSRRSVISRGDYQRRRAHQDAKWRARRREKDGQRQALYRKRERERRIGDQSDVWSRSGVSALRSRSRSRKSRVFGGLTSTHDPALPDFTFGLDSPFTQVAKDEEIEEVDDDEDEDEEDDSEEESSDEEEEEDEDESEEDEEDRGQAVFVQAAWDRYQRSWNKFRRAPPAPNSLRFVDIPWPAAISFPVPTTSSPIKALPPSSLEISSILNPQAIRDFLLSPYHSKEVPHKTRVETALSRYHPDQVMRWHNFVEESERIAVEVGAEMVFNSLRDLKAQLEHSGRPSQHATRAPHARRY